MRSNGTQKAGKKRVIESMSARHGKGGLQVVPEPSMSTKDPDQDTVISMVGHSLGPVLDGLSEAKKGIRKAQQFRRTAKGVGADEVEAMVARELRGLEAAARIDA